MNNTKKTANGIDALSHKFDLVNRSNINLTHPAALN